MASFDAVTFAETLDALCPVCVSSSHCEDHRTASFDVIGLICALDFLFGRLLDAGFDDLSSGCNPVCQFGCGCFMHQSVQISRKCVMISGKAFVFEHNEFKNCEFLLALQQFPSLSGGGFVMHLLLHFWFPRV